MSDSFIQQVSFTVYIDMAQPMAFHVPPMRFAKKKNKPKKNKEPPAFTEGSFGKCWQ